MNHLYAAALKRFDAAQVRLEELARLHTKLMTPKEIRALPDVREALVELDEATGGLIYAKAFYIYGPVYYVMGLCDECEELHWTPVPKEPEDRTYDTCVVCGFGEIRSPQTAHERMRIARATNANDTKVPFAESCGDRMDLDPRSRFSGAGEPAIEPCELPNVAGQIPYAR